jgi:hypothetical protein
MLALRALRGSVATGRAHLSSLAHDTPPAASALALQTEFGPKVYGGTEAGERAIETFRTWHRAIDAGMAGGDAKVILRPVVAKQCVFRPPTYFQPWTGSEEILILLDCVGGVFGPSFTYGRQWLSDDARHWALEVARERRAAHAGQKTRQPSS